MRIGIDCDDVLRDLITGIVDSINIGNNVFDTTTRIRIQY